MHPIKQRILTIVIVTISFSLTTCKKDDKVCGPFKELNDQQHLVDIDLLKDVPEFMDTLAKYPQLQLYKVINDQYIYGIHCNVFYKGLKVINHNYGIFKSKSENTIYCIDTIFDSINISLTPKIQFENAINIAKQNMNFDNSCISYRLGIYDLGNMQSNTTNRYKLIWKIQDEYGTPYVILDANSGQIYSQDDGIRY